MISSSRFADTRWDRLRRDCVGYLQIDQPAMAGATTWRLDSTDDVRGFLTRATREVVGDAEIHWASMRRTGDTSFFGVGLPTFAGIMSFTDEEIRRTALATLGWFHHSIHNTLDKVDRGHLALHLRVYARWLWELLTAPLLPFTYEPLAARLLGGLEALATTQVPEIELASVVDRARELRQAAAALDDLVSRERAGSDQAAADRLNQAMLGLSRLLVPLAATVAGPYGQDRYGHAWQAGAIPALGGYAALSDPATDPETRATTWVATIRARNRIADTLEHATTVARGAVT
jgi:hypothetical protein